MSIDYSDSWFQLFKTRGIGPKLWVRVAKILKAEDLNLKEILGLSQSERSARSLELAKILGENTATDNETVLKEYEELKRRGVNIIYPGHDYFPQHILEISPILFVKGRQKLLKSDGVAIVGARNVSDKGLCITKKLAGDLANEGLNIVSGYAKGVDSEAHLGALEVEGTTTLVLPCGIKQLQKKSVFKEFKWDRDVLAVSQFDPNSRWRARNAMIRNKLVCGLSKAVVVIESGPERDDQGKMSGTFNTAQTALRMGLPLFVLDPNCLDDVPKGNAELIKLGGSRLDPDNGAEEIVKRIFVESAKSASIENQDSAKQLPLFPDFCESR